MHIIYVYIIIYVTHLYNYKYYSLLEIRQFTSTIIKSIMHNKRVSKKNNLLQSAINRYISTLKYSNIL